ncbi:MAG TPA: hypothetical protein VMB73_15635 [Acetobacteraceae bacterium]|nr:hypothetical protein [Acetobacteraceae bacterium]
MSGSFVGVLTHLFADAALAFALSGSFVGVLTHLFADAALEARIVATGTPAKGAA